MRQDLHRRAVAKARCHRARCRPSDELVVLSLHQERRTTDAARVIDRIVCQPIEAMLHAEPEGDALGERKGRDAEEFQSIAERGTEPVERALENHGIGHDESAMGRAKNGRGAHRGAIEHQRPRGVFTHHSHRCRDILRFPPADRGAAALGITHTGEIDEPGLTARSVKLGRRAEQSILAPPVAREHQNRGASAPAGNPPRREAGGAGSAEGPRLEWKAEMGGRACVGHASNRRAEEDEARPVHPGIDLPESCRPSIDRRIVGDGPRVGEGDSIEREKQKSEPADADEAKVFPEGRLGGGGFEHFRVTGVACQIFHENSPLVPPLKRRMGESHQSR